MRKRGILLVCMFFLLVFIINVEYVYAEQDSSVSRPPDGIYFIRPAVSEKETVDFRPEYVTGEHLTFFSCIERASRVFNSVYCKNNPADVTPLDTFLWKNGCYISSYHIDSASCSELVVLAEYQQRDEILRWQEEIVITDVESIPYILLDTQTADGGWGDPVSTAWVIWALSEFSFGEHQTNTYATQIESGLRWLKENRNERNKCWPEDECNIRVTAEVLSMLYHANLTRRADWLRIVHDASVWLSLQQNLFNLIDPDETDSTTEKWTAHITGRNWTDGSIPVDYSSCLIKYEDELDLTLQVVFDVSYQINFTPKHYAVFDVICTPNTLPIIIKNTRDEVMFNSTTGNVSYKIPGPCWNHATPWANCDVTTTGFGANAPIGEIRTNLAIESLRKSLVNDDVGLFFDTADPFFDTAWFLYNRFGKDRDSDKKELSTTEQRILRWLLFNQNNDGSWGNASETFDENLLSTAMASIALSRVNNGSLVEFIKDSNIWISQNRPVDGWDTVKRDSIGFLAFSRSAKPFLLPRDGLVRMTRSEMDVELYNPSSFDFNSLEFLIEGEIEEYIEIDTIGSLASDYFKDIRIKLVDSPPQSVFGYISVLNEGYEVGRFPLLIQQVPEIEFSLRSRQIPIYNGRGSLVFDVKKSEGVILDCSLVFEDSSVTTRRRFSIDLQRSVETDFMVNEVRNQRKDYEGKFECSSDGMNMTFPFVVSTTQFETVPFSVFPKSINLTGPDDELYFEIRNNVDIEIMVNSEFETEDPFMIINQPQVTIPPLDSVIVQVTHYIAENETIVWDNMIRVFGYDRTEYVSVLVDHQARRSFSFMGLFFTLIIVFGILGGVGYVASSYKSELLNMLPSSLKSKLPATLFSSASVSSGDDDKNKHPMEKKVDAKNFVHVAELVKIMKGLGKDDDEISKKLQTEGYSRGEINELFKRVQEEMDAELSLEKEDKFMKLMKNLDSDVGAVRNKLKQDGFTDNEIREAFKQAEEEIMKKRTELDKKIKDPEKYDISKDDASKAEKGGDSDAVSTESKDAKEEKKDDKKE